MKTNFDIYVCHSFSELSSALLVLFSFKDLPSNTYHRAPFYDLCMQYTLHSWPAPCQHMATSC